MFHQIGFLECSNDSEWNELSHGFRYHLLDSVNAFPKLGLNYYDSVFVSIHMYPNIDTLFDIFKYLYKIEITYRCIKAKEKQFFSFFFFFFFLQKLYHLRILTKITVFWIVKIFDWKHFKQKFCRNEFHTKNLLDAYIYLPQEQSWRVLKIYHF